MARPVVVMGAAGVGKSTVGRQLARRLGGLFLEGDELHTPRCRRAMSRGVGLTDADRWPWLSTIAAELRRASASGRQVVIACSALRRCYREHLRSEAGPLLFLCLSAPETLLRARLEGRQGHFAGADLLPSQLATLELPDDDESAILVDASGGVDEVVRRALERIAGLGSSG